MQRVRDKMVGCICRRNVRCRVGLKSKGEEHGRERPKDQTGLVLYVCFPLFFHLRPAVDLRSSYFDAPHLDG